ncbi:hypothetical protein OOK27_16485 [Streptomyces canus]|uniref:hypothetical protein n=1 Tax=Streptomyces canus TaxID=58343 RepID=UPI0022571933|nr:hypothetical protein [Streptomyces canus]MCX5255717.1 hypothetical protein [Streptomyces canus]
MSRASAVGSRSRCRTRPAAVGQRFDAHLGDHRDWADGHPALLYAAELDAVTGFGPM